MCISITSNRLILVNNSPSNVIIEIIDCKLSGVVKCILKYVEQIKITLCKYLMQLIWAFYFSGRLQYLQLDDENRLDTTFLTCLLIFLLQFVTRSYRLCWSRSLIREQTKLLRQPVTQIGVMDPLKPSIHIFLSTETVLCNRFISAIVRLHI